MLVVFAEGVHRLLQVVRYQELIALNASATSNSITGYQGRSPWLVRTDGGVSGSVIEAASAICIDAGVDPLFPSHRRWSVAGRLALQVLDDYKFNLRSVGVIRSN